jgi:3-hydroxyisobutyrate dehydrogenase-like beta-hydroxyacid dehydrogenase
MTAVAWLGTGLLGSGFVEAALGRGDEVTVWNRTASKTEALAASGARVAATPADCVRGAERVHLCLSDDAAVDAVVEALLPALAPSAAIVDHTTVSPAGARARVARLRARGVDLVAAPVFMGPQNAREATGRMLVGGAEAVVERLAPALSRMTGQLVRLGEDVGRPCALKLVGNALIIGLAASFADALAVGLRSGLAAEEVRDFAAHFPFGAVVAGRASRMVAGDYAPSFELSMARKDVRLMVEAAADLPLAVLPGLAARLDALIEAGHGAKDLGALSVATIPPSAAPTRAGGKP